MAEGLLTAHTAGRHCLSDGSQVNASRRVAVMQGVNSLLGVVRQRGCTAGSEQPAGSDLDMCSEHHGQRQMCCVWCCIGLFRTLRLEVP